MELQLHKLFEMHFFLNNMCLNEAGKLAQGSLYLGIELRAWSNLLIFIGWQHFMLERSGESNME